jgi:uncharacterized protein YdaU (DUF1376 family)
MGKDPAFLFYPNDWLGGTLGMSFEEKGAYMELLMLQFNRGHMTPDMIAQTAGRLWDKLKDKFAVDEEGKYYNRRLEYEIKRRRAYCLSRENNKEGKNQYSKRGHMTSRTAGHMENRNENETETKADKEKKGFGEEKGFVPPTPEEVRAYCEERNNGIDAKRFWDYYAAAGWTDSKGAKVKNWKQRVITWERRQERAPPPGTETPEQYRF